MIAEVISRAQAIAAGSPYYFSGKPCPKGHIDLRRVDNRGCKACHNKQQKVAGDVASARNRARYAKNADRIKEAVKAYRRSNREVLADRMRDYRQRKPWVLKALNAKRRAAHANAVPSWRDELDMLVDVEARDLCRLRAAATGFGWHTDHMIPLQAADACGLHVGANLQVIPALLNVTKSNRMMLTKLGEWIWHA